MPETISDEPRSLEQLVQSWPLADRERALAEIKARAKGQRFVFYCTRGRGCDGNPHEGAPYQHARSDQWPPIGNDWFTWMVRSGRGSGKTRTGSEWTRSISGKVDRIAMIGRRGKDVRGTMVEGPSGLIYACERAGVSYDWKPSQMEFTFGNGAKAFGYSAEEPDSLRGPQHGAGWVDEPAHMAEIVDVWMNLLYGMRLPGHPGGARILCTSTPLPLKWLKDLEDKKSTKVVRVSTKANLVNLDPMFIENVIQPMEGTRNGRQELEGEILSDTPGAIWKSDWLRYVANDFDWKSTLERIIVAIDPAGTANRRSDETGIVVVGIAGNRLYVLGDYSGKYSPKGWAGEALRVAQMWEADAVIAEQNFGGDMVKTTIDSVAEEKGQLVAVRVVRAQRSKELRAEPIASLYERELVAHMPGLEELESEMLSWVPGKGASPNRVDALVWAATELVGDKPMVGDAAFPAEMNMRGVPSGKNAVPYGMLPEGVVALSPEAAVARKAEYDRMNFTPPGRSFSRMARR